MNKEQKQKIKKEYKRLIPEMILMGSLIFTTIATLNTIATQANFNHQINDLEYNKIELSRSYNDINQINAEKSLINERINQIEEERDNSKELINSTTCMVAGATTSAVCIGAIAIRNSKEENEENENTL